MASRKVALVFENALVAEGNGFVIRRGVGSKELGKIVGGQGEIDPFVLMDYGSTTYPQGTIDHPHRGFQAVLYCLEGAITHEDFYGGHGELKGGDFEWMTAGRGIVHAEFPNPTVTAIQLWVSLSKANKMVEPSYQHLRKAEVPVASRDGVTVAVLAGESMGIKSPLRTLTPVHYMDFRLKGGSKFSQPVNDGWNTIAFTLAGTLLFGPPGAQVSVKPYHTVIFEKSGGEVHFENPSTNSEDEARFILLSGQPLNEPIFRHGGKYGVIMNSPEEVEQCLEDYKECRNGFENSKTWKSHWKRDQEAQAAAS